MKNSLLKKVVNKAITVLENNKWCRGTFARDKKGYSVSTSSKRACSFCAAGAIKKASPKYGNTVWDNVDTYIETNIPSYSGLTNFNDSKATEKRDVIRLLKRYLKFLDKSE